MLNRTDLKPTLTQQAAQRKWNPSSALNTAQLPGPFVVVGYPFWGWFIKIDLKRKGKLKGNHPFWCSPTQIPTEAPSHASDATGRCEGQNHRHRPGDANGQRLAMDSSCRETSRFLLVSLEKSSQQKPPPKHTHTQFVNIRVAHAFFPGIISSNLPKLR